METETENVIGLDMSQVFRLIEVEEGGSRSAFARKIGGAPSLVYNWEKYHTYPSMDSFINILNAYRAYPPGYYFVKNKVKKG